MSLFHLLTEAGLLCVENQSMARYTTFRIGGPADICVKPRSRTELLRTLDIWRQSGEGCPLCVLGYGSNVLVSDKGFRGLVIFTGELRQVNFRSPTEEEPTHTWTVTADSGVSLTALAAACLQERRHVSGLEFAYGIPGSLGGAVVMNAGAYGGEMAQVVVRTVAYELTTGQMLDVVGEAHHFSYRHSLYQENPDLVVLEATLALKEAPEEIIRDTMQQHLCARREKQPLHLPSAGSTFKRPTVPGMYVGRMVEECHLKGYRVGGAQVSTMHGGFVVNTGGATAADVLAVVRHVKETIAHEYHIDLECEIRMIGEM